MDNSKTFIGNIDTTKLTSIVGFAPTPVNTLEKIFSELNKVVPLNGKKLLDFGSGDLRISLFVSNHYDTKCIAVEKHHKISMFGDNVLKQATTNGLSNNIKYLPYTNAFNVNWKNKDIIFYFYGEPIYSPLFAFNIKEKLRDKIFACLYIKEQFNEEKQIYPLDEFLTPMGEPIKISDDWDGLVLCLYTL